MSLYQQYVLLQLEIAGSAHVLHFLFVVAGTLVGCSLLCSLRDDETDSLI